MLTQSAGTQSRAMLVIRERADPVRSTLTRVLRPIKSLKCCNDAREPPHRAAQLRCPCDEQAALVRADDACALLWPSRL
jgi:hypothetical protein